MHSTYKVWCLTKQKVLKWTNFCAGALDASIISDSGETATGDIEYSGLDGVFNILFTMTRIGKASLEVKYQTDNGFALIDDTPQVINIRAASISVKNSDLECF